MNVTLTCRQAVEELWAFLDGELPPEMADRVQRHLEACRECYPHYDFQRAFREMLRARSRAEIPGDLRRHILRTLSLHDADGA